MVHRRPEIFYHMNGSGFGNRRAQSCWRHLALGFVEKLPTKGWIENLLMVAYAMLSRGRSAESCRNMAKEDHAKMRESGGPLVYYADYKSAEDANAGRRRHAAG